VVGLVGAGELVGTGVGGQEGDGVGGEHALGVPFAHQGGQPPGGAAWQAGVQPLLGLIDQVQPRPRPGKQASVGVAGAALECFLALLDDGLARGGGGGAGVAQAPEGGAHDRPNVVDGDVEIAAAGQREAVGGVMEDVDEHPGPCDGLAQGQLDP
jgi:hypothetical protein